MILGQNELWATHLCQITLVIHISQKDLLKYRIYRRRLNEMYRVSLFTSHGDFEHLFVYLPPLDPQHHGIVGKDLLPCCNFAKISL